MRRLRMTRPVIAVITAAAVAAITGTVVAQATTVSVHRHGRAREAVVATCPAATICAFSGTDETGTEAQFTTASSHSAWIDFDSVAGFHPASIIDNSGSDIWVYDQENAEAGVSIDGQPYCAFGTSLQGYTFYNYALNSPDCDCYTQTYYQPGWFFIQYNVNTCETQPPPPPA